MMQMGTASALHCLGSVQAEAVLTGTNAVFNAGVKA